MIGLSLFDAAFLAVVSATSAPPSSDTNIVLWARADALVSTNGEMSVVWPDSSGGADLTGISTNAPTWYTNQVNGLPAWNFKNADLVHGNAWACARTVGNSFHLLAVAKLNAGTAKSRFLLINSFLYFAAIENGTNFAFRSASSGIVKVGPVATNDAYTLLEWIDDNDALECFQDGVSAGTLSPGTMFGAGDGFSGLCGDVGTLAGAYLGWAAEFKLYAEAGTVSQRLARREALRVKYSLY